jgi:preprotein translocase subunit YajC
MDQTLATVVYVALIVGVFYFLWYRPQQAQQKRVREMMELLAPGDRVMTAGGMLGVVRSLEDDVARVEIADGVIVRFRKRAIAERLTEPTGPGE